MEINLTYWQLDLEGEKQGKNITSPSLHIFSRPGLSSPFHFLLSATSSSLRGAGWMENGHCIQFVTIHPSFLRLLTCSSMGPLLQDKPAAAWVLQQPWFFSNICSSMDSSREVFFQERPTCSAVLTSMGYSCPSLALTMDCRGTALVPGAPPPPPSRVTLLCTGSFLVFAVFFPSPLCFLAFCLFKNILPQNQHQLGWRAQLCLSWLSHVGRWNQPHLASCSPCPLLTQEHCPKPSSSQI